MRISRVVYEKSTGSEWSFGTNPVGDGAQTVLFLFGEQSYFGEAGIWNALRQRYPQALWIGCSGAGEIADGRICDQAIVGAAVQFEHTTLKQAAVTVSALDQSAKAGAELARQLQGDDLRAVFVVTDGLEVDGAALIEGLSQAVDSRVVVTGGMAGDGDRFERTWVLSAAGPQTGCAVAIGFYGAKLHVGSGCQGGWDKFGPSRRVTRAEGPVLYELDGKPALDLYKQYLGEYASGLPSTGLRFPLAVVTNAEEALVRTILKVDEATQSLTFAGHIPVGVLTQFMKANSERLIEGAAKAAEMAAVQTSGSLATLAVAVSCVGRRLVLGTRTEDELDAVASVMPKETYQIGFYSYGEFAPHNLAPGNKGKPSFGASALHNQTMTITVFQEFE